MIRSIISGLLAAVLILGAAFFMGSAAIAASCGKGMCMWLTPQRFYRHQQ